MAAGKKIQLKIESSTSAEFDVEMKETDLVKDLIEIVKRNWGDDGYVTAYHLGEKMKAHKPLSAYFVTNGSVIKVMYDADSP